MLEKPCTLVLVEDSFLYDITWNDAFHLNIPAKHGMAFMSLTLNLSNGLDGMIDEMKQDLPAVHDAILVTRGPIASWVALFYLESFSLKGLVMIDPVPFDYLRNNAANVGIEASPSALLHNEESLNGDLLLQASAKVLQLEPNSVPMFVIQSIEGPRNNDYILQVAERHSDPDGPFGKVTTAHLIGETPDLVMHKIDEWVETIL